MNKKYIRYGVMGIVVLVLSLVVFIILKYTCSCSFLRGLGDPLGVPHSSRIHEEISIPKYEVQLSPEVLKALEKRKQSSPKAKNPAFDGLSLVPDLGTNRLVLRAMEERDLDDLTEIFSDYETIYMLTYMPWPFNRDNTLRYMENLSWDIKRGHSLYWAITLPEQDRLMGVIGITLTHEHNRARIHYWLSLKHRNKGYMTEVVRRIVDYIFKDLNINRFDAEILTINAASQHVIKKCGFKMEGEFDDYVKKGERYENIRFYRLLQREYLKTQEAK